MRPIYHFNNFFSIQFEAGFDHTDADGGDSGELLKLTLAPQITPGRGFFSRPSIRTFVTYAHWSGSFEGQIAPRTYGTDTNGFSAGVQAEAWW